MNLLKPTLQQALTPLRENNWRIIVTGASGWLGMALLDLLSGALGPTSQSRIFAATRKPKPLTLRDGTVIETVSHTSLLKLSGDTPCLLCDFAFPGKEQLRGHSAKDYLALCQALAGWRAQLLAQLPIAAVLAPSSGAVNQANAYGQAKQEVVEQYRAWATAKGTPLIVPEIYNLSGAYINKWGDYALANLLINALRDEPLTIHASHRVYRNYVLVEDLLTASLGWLLRAPSGSQWHLQVGGAHTLEIGELAELIKATLDKPDLPIIRPPLTSAVDDVYAASSALFNILCQEVGGGLHPTDIATQIRLTADYLQAALGQCLNSQ